MSIDTIESSIDEDLKVHMRGLVLKGVLKNAGTTKLPDIVKLTEHARFGDVASNISLQEIIDAYVEGNNLVEQTMEDPPPSPPAGKGRRKASKKKAAKKASKKAAKKKASSDEVDRKGGGGGSAKPGHQVNFRDPDERSRYANSIETMVREREGGAVSSTELVDRCGGSSNQAREILKTLVDEGKVVYTGNARATRYYWRSQATDEILAEFQKQQAEENKGKGSDNAA